MEKTGHNNETSWVEWWGDLAGDMGIALAKGEDLTLDRTSIVNLLGALEKATAGAAENLEDPILMRLSREAWTGYGMHAVASATATNG